MGDNGSKAAQIGGSIKCFLASAIYTLTIPTSGWILSASGWLLDKVFLFTVVDLKAQIGENGPGGGGFYPVIRLVWGMFRDLINMSFIFLLLWASIMTIVEADTKQLKNVVKNVIIVAVLINFSLFFTEVIIDVSNSAAVAIYNQINQGNGDTNTNNLSDAFMKNLQLESLLTKTPTISTDSDLQKIITISIFGSIFVLILAVVFFVISILFIVRFVTFIILLMMSPAGIASLAIPKLKSSFGGSFWGDLISQSFFAPIMILFIWITVKLLPAITALSNTTPSSNSGIKIVGGTNTIPPLSETFTDPTTAGTNLGRFILGFIIIIYLLIKGMEIAKSMSAKGAGAVQSGMLKYSGANWVQDKMKNAPKSAFNGAKYAGGATLRNTAGRGASRLAESSTFKKWAANNAIARTLYKGTAKTADAKFGGKSGFSTNETATQKEKEKFREVLAKKSFAEEQEIAAHSKAKKDAENNNKLADEHMKVLEAEEKFNEHETKLNEIMEKALSPEKYDEYIKAKLLIADGTADENTIKEASSNVKSLEATAEKEVEALNKGLEGAFGKLGINIKAGDSSTHIKALSRLSDARADAQAQDNDRLFVGKSFEDISKMKESLADREYETSRAADSAIKDINKANKDRQEDYAQALASPRMFNLGFPSKASQRAALTVRKEANKGEEAKAIEAATKQIKKALGIKEEGGGDSKEKKEEKKPESK